VLSKFISLDVIVPFSPAYSINFLISLISSCIFVPQHSIKYLVVASSIFTLYALHIFFILLISSGSFNSVNSITSPFFSIDLYNEFFSASSSTKIISTVSFICFIFFSIYSASLSTIVLAFSSFLVVFLLFLNIPVFLASIIFFVYPNGGVSISEIILSISVSPICI